MLHCWCLDRVVLGLSAVMRIVRRIAAGGAALDRAGKHHQSGEVGLEATPADVLSSSCSAVGPQHSGDPALRRHFLDDETVNILWQQDVDLGLTLDDFGAFRYFSDELEKELTDKNSIDLDEILDEVILPDLTAEKGDSSALRGPDVDTGSLWTELDYSIDAETGEYVFRAESVGAGFPALDRGDESGPTCSLEYGDDCSRCGCGECFACHQFQHPPRPASDPSTGSLEDRWKDINTSLSLSLGDRDGVLTTSGQGPRSVPSLGSQCFSSGSIGSPCQLSSLGSSTGLALSAVVRPSSFVKASTPLSPLMESSANASPSIHVSRLSPFVVSSANLASLSFTGSMSPSMLTPSVSVESLSFPGSTSPSMLTPSVSVESLSFPGSMSPSMLTPLASVESLPFPGSMSPSMLTPSVSVESLPFPGSMSPSMLTPLASVESLPFPGSMSPSMLTPSVSVESLPFPGSMSPSMLTPLASVESLPFPGSMSPSMLTPLASVESLPFPGSMSPSMLTPSVSVESLPFPGSMSPSMLTPLASVESLPFPGSMSPSMLIPLASVESLPFPGSTSPSILSPLASVESLPFPGSTSPSTCSGGVSTSDGRSQPVSLLQRRFAAPSRPGGHAGTHPVPSADDALRALSQLVGVPVRGADVIGPQMPAPCSAALQADTIASATCGTPVDAMHARGEFEAPAFVPVASSWCAPTSVAVTCQQPVAPISTAASRSRELGFPQRMLFNDDLARSCPSDIRRDPGVLTNSWCGGMFTNPSSSHAVGGHAQIVSPSPVVNNMYQLFGKRLRQETYDPASTDSPDQLPEAKCLRTADAPPCSGAMSPPSVPDVPVQSPHTVRPVQPFIKDVPAPPPVTVRPVKPPFSDHPSVQPPISDHQARPPISDRPVRLPFTYRSIPPSITITPVPPSVIDRPAHQSVCDRSIPPFNSAKPSIADRPVLFTKAGCTRGQLRLHDAAPPDPMFVNGFMCDMESDDKVTRQKEAVVQLPCTLIDMSGSAEEDASIKDVGDAESAEDVSIEDVGDAESAEDVSIEDVGDAERTPDVALLLGVTLPDPVSRPCRQTRNERVAASLRLPYSVKQIVEASTEDYSGMLEDDRIDQQQRSAIREIRRRYKNKVAAHQCRQRKLREIAALSAAVERDRLELASLRDQHDSLSACRRSVIDHYNRLYQHVLRAVQTPGADDCLQQLQPSVDQQLI